MVDLGLSFNRANTIAFVPQSFKDRLKKQFERMDEAKADFMDYLNDYLMLEEQINKGKAPHDEDTSDYMAEIHDNMLEATDRVLLFYAFLLKNYGSLRPAIRAIKGEVESELEMHLMPYCNINYIAKEWEVMVKDCYDFLEDMRSYFLPEVKDDRYISGWKDDFALTFLDGGEMPRERIFDRIEYLFFEKYGVPLGIFDVSDDVAEYIAQETRLELYTINLTQDLRTGKLASKFPGLMLYTPRNKVDEDAPRIKTKVALEANSHNVHGMITHPRLIFKPRNGFF